MRRQRSHYDVSVMLNGVSVALTCQPTVYLQCEPAKEVDYTCKEENMVKARARCVDLQKEPFTTCHSLVRGVSYVYIYIYVHMYACMHACL